VARPPDAVVLVLDERPLAMGIQVVVTGPAGPVQRGAPTIAGNSVRQPLAGDAPAGKYTVAWRVASADGVPRVQVGR
jgi:copper resistance protein C